MAEVPEPLLVEPGDLVPADLPANTPVYRRIDPSALPFAAVPLPDGCLGKHWPESPVCIDFFDVQ